MHDSKLKANNAKYNNSNKKGKALSAIDAYTQGRATLIPAFAKGNGCKMSCSNGAHRSAQITDSDTAAGAPLGVLQ